MTKTSMWDRMPWENEDVTEPPKLGGLKNKQKHFCLLLIDKAKAKEKTYM